MNCYKIEDNRKDVILTLNKHWIFDTVSINWNGVKVLEEDEPIPLPTSVPVLLKHKVKTRNILSQEFKRCCSLYLFVYDGDNYTPIKVKTLRGHMNCYKIEDNRKDVILTLNKHWIFDAVSINWNGVKVLEEDEPIPLPTSVPVLLKHKVKTRNILSQDYEIQYSIKQGTNWFNMTRHYRSAKRGFVKKACESIEMIPFSADKNVNHKMQPILV